MCKQNEKVTNYPTVSAKKILQSLKDEKKFKEKFEIMFTNIFKAVDGDRRSEWDPGSHSPPNCCHI